MSTPPDVLRFEMLLVCDEVAQSHWELPLPVSGTATLTLLGWLVRPESVDAGVPEPVVSAFSEALARCGLVSFFAGRPRSRLLGSLLSRGSDDERNVRRATDPQMVARVFDDPYFDWSQRGQVAFLSPSARPPPRIGLRDLEEVLTRPDCDSLRSRGVNALLLPGVDGDVAGLYALDAEIGERLRRALDDAVTQRKAEWRQVTEVDFARALAGS